MNSKITIILTAHKSKKLVLNHLKNLYDYFKIIVIDNSNDLVLKKEISQKYPNVIFRIMDNNGYGSAVNYAVKFVD